MTRGDFPVFPDTEHVFCFHCKARITGPFQASGFAERHGAWRGQCTGPNGCGLITYFDLECDEPEPVRP